jgi:2-oxoglutarate dehydrogenase E2 component (dihydrolipoamide succinyltransferase)
MAIDIIMPKMGESITEGTITEWKKKVGDQVKKDETILEISTDKVDTEVPSPASGTLIQIISKENETVDVGTTIGYIGKKGESPGKDTPNKVEEKPKPKKQTNKTKETKKVISLQKEFKPDSHLESSQKSQKFYSPLVRSIAKREGIAISELDQISGSGRGGRVNKNDLMKFIETGESNVASSISTPSNIYLNDKIEEMDPVRKRISEHMIHSQETSAHVYSTIEIDMTNLLQVKDTYRQIYKDKHSIKLTITALIIDACIKALNEFPLLNASIDGTTIIYHKNINMGVAVSLEDNNLIVPVIKSSEELNLIGISRSLEDLSIRSRNKKLDLDEVQGSTFTITNPGVFGGLFGIPILNQPNVGILSIGKIQKKPIVKETEFGDSIFIRSMMYATLGYDHRLIDGAYGTKFLSYLSQIIESYEDKLEK